MNEKVMVGMSGGVDSSVAAALLMEKGYVVGGLTLSLCEDDSEQNNRDAAVICKRLEIPHCSVNLGEAFKRYVVDNFTEQYIMGKTPNPCIECNKYIKFGKMIDVAIEKGYDKIATGHYARITVNSEGRYLLKTGKDLSKDQSYVLYNLTQEQLSRVLFPLGDYTKQEIREKAESLGFVNADRPDSQDICFVPDGDYASFIEKTADFISKDGDFVDINGNLLGKHRGVIHYTIGQRKGLGISFGKPQFIIDKNSETNCVVLGDEEFLFKRRVEVEDVNFIPFDRLEDEMRVEAKLRYRHNAQPATIIPNGENRVIIEFDEPQRAPSAGQSAVFYSGDIVVGGGKIV